MIKSNIIRWAVHVEHSVSLGMHRKFVFKRVGKRQVGKLSRRWEGFIKTGLRVECYEDLDSIILAEGRVQ
jgi:hypothetical protein